MHHYKIFYVASEGNICEPCVYNYKFTNKDVNLTTNSITELNTPDCLTCSEEIEKYNVINVLTETFLEIMKYPIVSDNRRHIDNGKLFNKLENKL